MAETEQPFALSSDSPDEELIDIAASQGDTESHCVQSLAARLH